MGNYTVAGSGVAEEHGTPRETWTKDGFTCGAELRCAWSERHTIAADLLANRRPWPGHAGWTYPARCSNVAIRPFPTDYTVVGQEIVYQHALLNVSYSTAETTDLLSESLEPVVQFLTLDHRRFRWGAADGDPLLEEEAPGKLYKMVNLVRTFYNVEPPLHTDLINLAGTSNDSLLSSVLLGGLTFAQGTLLYEPPSLQRTIKTDGSGFQFNITQKFAYKPQTWNKFWRAKSESWESIFDVDGGAAYENYPEADWSNIWSV